MTVLASKRLRVAHTRQPASEFGLQGARQPLLSRMAESELHRELRATREQLRLAKAELAQVRARERRATQMALHDSLTTLPNRALFRSRLEEALQFRCESNQGVAVMYIDLDGFKHVNDTHGHAVGDELLHIIGTRLARSVRVGDTVARLGGDEFACLLIGVVDPAQVQHRAQELMKAVSAQLRIGKRSITGRASIGVAISPIDGLDADELLQHADRAMYRAKQSGSGIEFYRYSSG